MKSLLHIRMRVPRLSLQNELPRYRASVVLALSVLLAGSLFGADLDKPGIEVKPPTPAQTTASDAAIAHDAWQALEALRLPAEPAEWAKRTPIEEEQREHQQKQAEYACRASDQARDFYTRFPNHDMAPVAKVREREFVEPFRMYLLEYRASRFEEEAEKRPQQDRAQVLAEVEKHNTENVMYRTAGPEPDSQWCEKVVKFLE